MATTKHPRALPPSGRVALDVVALMGSRRLALNEFTLRMFERGCDSKDTANAIAVFERRGWARKTTHALEISAKGYAAALRGPPHPRKKPSPRPANRMPKGLFS